MESMVLHWQIIFFFVKVVFCFVKQMVCSSMGGGAGAGRHAASTPQHWVRQRHALGLEQYHSDILRIIINYTILYYSLYSWIINWRTLKTFKTNPIAPDSFLRSAIQQSRRKLGPIDGGWAPTVRNGVGTPRKVDCMMKVNHCVISDNDRAQAEFENLR